MSERMPGTPGPTRASDRGQSPKTLLFVLKHLGMVRYYEPTLRVLAERGHDVRIAHSTSRTSNAVLYGERLVAANPTITLHDAPARRSRTWSTAAAAVRLTMDYVRYFDSRFSSTTILRTRVEGKFIPRWARIALAPLSLFGDRGVRTAIRFLRRLEQAIPVSPEALAFVRETRPDLVLVSPLVDWGSPLVDYVRAAETLGIPSAVGVASWDNLTNKGHLRVAPTRVFVWNDAQKDEATSFHDIPAGNVVATGAQLFDHLFRLEPSSDRRSFCTKVGLDPERPFIVFLGSTVWIAPQELYFVERWIRRLRAADDPRVAGVGIMLRPHPTTSRRYLSLDVSQLDNVCIWPDPRTPIPDYFTPHGQQDFVDVLQHCRAVVGANTSAQIDAGIVGRPVCTVEVPEFANSHDGTLHFAHLATGTNPLLRVAENLDAHVRDLGEILARDEGIDERSRAFVQSFVRPRGLDLPAAPILADEIERAAELSVEPRPMPVSGIPLRLLLAFPAWLGAPRTSSKSKGARRKNSKQKATPLWLRLAQPLVRAWAFMVLLRVVLTRARMRRLGSRLRQRASALLPGGPRRAGPAMANASSSDQHPPSPTGISAEGPGPDDA